MLQRRSLYLALMAGVAVVAATAAIGQQTPESLLPPGFGDPVPETPRPAQPQQPTPLVPAQPAAAPSLSLDLSESGNESAAAEDAEGEEEEQEAKVYDLPPDAHRALTRIGPLTPATRGFGPDAFGRAGGQYLSILMQKTRAPIVSRWGSILLRRALLSAVDTPSTVNGANFAAERAWLLLRMGEADAARMMVQSVDPDKYTPRLYAVAMQVYLANADPAGLCPIVEPASQTSDEPGWDMARAICASLSGDQGTASAVLNQVQRQGTARGIDYRLAEKVVGAGLNGRRAVNIEWAGVDKITSWRLGMAMATGVAIPPDLIKTLDPRVQAWRARAPMLSLAERQPAAEAAAKLGVFSSAALVDVYAVRAEQPDLDPAVAEELRTLRQCYIAPTFRERLDAMHAFWTREGHGYDALIATARAAARLPVTDQVGDDVKPLVAAMLTAGLDRNAAPWLGVADKIGGAAGQDAWAMLALGSPDYAQRITASRIKDYAGSDESAEALKTKMLLAGLIGIGRLSPQEAGDLVRDNGITLTPNSRWSRAITLAAQRREAGTVALLAAVGMQTSDWRNMSPTHLYFIVSSLRQVGLDPEARMIAAEAIARL